MATCLIMAKSKFRSVQNLKVICHHLQLTEILVVMTTQCWFMQEKF